MAAYEYDHFDYPKNIDLSGLSQILGIKPSTLDEILRRAIKKVVREYISGRYIGLSVNLAMTGSLEILIY
ncbi:MAG: helix-turn-helix domain-containing protein [Sulfolobales archaeon]